MSIEHNIQRIADALEALVELLTNRPAADAAEVTGQAIEKASRRGRKSAADTTAAAAATSAPETAAPQTSSQEASVPQTPPPDAPAGTPAPSVADCQAKAAALSAKIGSGPVLALIAESGCAKISAMSDAQRTTFFNGMAALEQPSAANAFE